MNNKMPKILDKTQSWMGALSPVIAAFGILLVILPVVSGLRGQSTAHNLSDYQFKELEKRVDSLDQLTVAVNSIDRRTLILETMQRENGNDSPWQRGTSVGTGVLLIEAAFRFGKKKYGLTLEKEEGD